MASFICHGFGVTKQVRLERIVRPHCTPMKSRVRRSHMHEAAVRTVPARRGPAPPGAARRDELAERELSRAGCCELPRQPAEGRGRDKHDAPKEPVVRSAASCCGPLKEQLLLVRPNA